MTEDWKVNLRQRQQLLGQYHAACDAVHAITGRTDQSYHQIAEFYPDHDAVKALREAEKRLDEFDAKA